MNRALVRFSKKCALALASVGMLAGLSLVAPREASAQEDVYPDDAYLATAEPVYYNGFAHYFYHNHWYYRDHGAWRGYDHEPGFLHDRRGEWAHHAHHWR